MGEWTYSSTYFPYFHIKGKRTKRNGKKEKRKTALKICVLFEWTWVRLRLFSTAGNSGRMRDLICENGYMVSGSAYRMDEK
jgi:hypothetical protein